MCGRGSWLRGWGLRLEGRRRECFSNTSQQDQRGLWGFGRLEQVVLIRCGAVEQQWSRQSCLP